MDQRFSKEERLCSKGIIRKLFEEGKKSNVYPFRITYLACSIPSDFPVQLLVSVPKSIFRKAADRNRIKRLIREGYRLNKHLLYDLLKEKNIQIALCIQYTSKEMLPFTFIQEKIIVLLQRLRKENAEIAE